MKNESILKSANPITILFLGACPAVAVTNNVLAALGMGVAVLAVMLLSSAIISAVKALIPQRVRVAAYILIIAGVVSLVQMLMNALLPDIYRMLGVYIAVSAVDLLIFSRAEETPGQSFKRSMGDSLLTGLVFLLALAVMAVFREILGSGSLAGVAIPFMKGYTMSMLTQAPGGLLMFAILLAVINAVRPMQAKPEPAFTAAASGIYAEQNGEDEK